MKKRALTAHARPDDEHLEQDTQGRVSGEVDHDTAASDFELFEFDEEEEFEVPDLPPPGLADFDDL